jgi:hypothetical protein
MKIKNIDGLSALELQKAVKDGGRFVYFTCTISLLIITLRDTSGVYLIRSGENSIRKSILFTAVSFFTGWWGIPFGPKYTLQALRINYRGGKDVTDEVMSVVEGYLLFDEHNADKK